MRAACAAPGCAARATRKQHRLPTRTVPLR
ncbi:hypothetical protein ACILG0_00410 [Pseudomonadota bacterium AL_CKDN230030165-1A_HGKHYDSX7]